MRGRHANEGAPCLYPPSSPEHCGCSSERGYRAEAMGAGCHYQVEAAYLRSAACAALIATGVHIARPYAVQLEPCDESPLASRFSLLLEDFVPTDGWNQENFFTLPQVRRQECSP